MENRWVKYTFAVVPLLLLVLHLLWPSLRIDPITIALLFIAALPWIGPVLKNLASSGVKSVELPGIKIEMRDVKHATDKVIHGHLDATLPMLKLKATMSESIPSPQEEKQAKETEDPIAYIREVANADSNLSLVAFRIEIEKRIRRIAEISNLKSTRQSLNLIIKQLQDKKALSLEVSSGLMELIAFGNSAAHGVKVDDAAAQWVLDVGPSIIIKLDNIISGK